MFFLQHSHFLYRHVDRRFNLFDIIPHMCNFVFTDWQLPAAMSRFFATGSDSESEESSSADEITPKAPGTTFKQSVQLVLNPITASQIPVFVVISHIRVVFTGRCFLVMMKRTLREWCAAPKTKGWCGVVLSSISLKLNRLSNQFLNAFTHKS